jgi:hypothetical protein
MTYGVRFAAGFRGAGRALEALGAFAGWTGSTGGRLVRFHAGDSPCSFLKVAKRSFCAVFGSSVKSHFYCRERWRSRALSKERIRQSRFL